MNSGKKTADFIIIGGGIAGASAGYELSKSGRVIILEKESLPGYHATGRSSAIFQKSYNHGDRLLNILVRASEDFLANPPTEFTPLSLLSPRPLLYIVPNDKRQSLDALRHSLHKINIETRYIDKNEAAEFLPILSPDYQDNILLEEGVADMDVDALHQGYLRAIKTCGGEVITDAQVTHIEKRGPQWHVCTAHGGYTAKVIINAAGAWVDEVAKMAHIAPINIQPLRRTVIMIALEEGMSPNKWPVVIDANKGYYFKPDSGKILLSPGDSHLAPPSDAQPEEIDIAYGVHFLEQATTLRVNKIDHSWAGLRSQVADGHPVVGFDPAASGFFWLAGQGGFGIKTAPAMARICAALITTGRMPQDTVGLGLTEDQISITRLVPR